MDKDRIFDSWTTVEDIECSIAKSKRTFELAMERLKALRGQNAETQTPSDTSQTSDNFDVSHHYPYCQSNPEDKGLILKASTDVIEGCITAEAFCKENGMETVVIRTREEFDQVASFLNSTGLSSGEEINFYVNGHVNREMKDTFHRCHGYACGSDMIVWDDPGGLPFDSTIYGDSWLLPETGPKIRDCMALKLYSKKTDTFHGVANVGTKFAVCMARCGEYYVV